MQPFEKRIRVHTHPRGGVGLALRQLDAAHRCVIHGGERRQEPVAVAHCNTNRASVIGLGFGYCRSNQIPR